MGSNQKLYKRTQALAILLGGISPTIVVLQTAVPETQGSFMVITAILPALAAIITGFTGIFQWKEDFLKSAQSAENLKSEKLKFLTRTTDEYNSELDDHKVLNNFVRKVEEIILGNKPDQLTQVEGT